MIERFAFYERPKQAFVVVATGDGALYGNIILKKACYRQNNLKTVVVLILRFGTFLKIMS